MNLIFGSCRSSIYSALHDAKINHHFSQRLLCTTGNWRITQNVDLITSYISCFNSIRWAEYLTKYSTKYYLTMQFICIMISFAVHRGLGFVLTAINMKSSIFWVWRRVVATWLLLISFFTYSPTPKRWRVSAETTRRRNPEISYSSLCP
jgi:hypothetical protein